MESKISHAQHIALGHYLHAYPDDLSFMDILYKLLEDDELVTVSESYEDHEREFLALEIEYLAGAIQEYGDNRI
jgi:hypothetical protein